MLTMMQLKRPMYCGPWIGYWREYYKLQDAHFDYWREVWFCCVPERGSHTDYVYYLIQASRRRREYAHAAITRLQWEYTGKYLGLPQPEGNVV